MLNLTASIYSQLYSPFPSALCEQSLWQPSHVDIVTHSKDVTVSSPVCAGCCSLRSRPALLAKVPCRIKQTGGSPLVSQEGTTWYRQIQSFHLGILGNLGSSFALLYCLKNLSCDQYPFVQQRRNEPLKRQSKQAFYDLSTHLRRDLNTE